MLQSVDCTFTSALARHRHPWELLCCRRRNATPCQETQALCFHRINVYELGLNQRKAGISPHTHIVQTKRRLDELPLLQDKEKRSTASHPCNWAFTPPKRKINSFSVIFFKTMHIHGDHRLEMPGGHQPRAAALDSQGSPSRGARSEGEKPPGAKPGEPPAPPGARLCRPFLTTTREIPNHRRATLSPGSGCHKTAPAGAALPRPEGEAGRRARPPRPAPLRQAGGAGGAGPRPRGGFPRRASRSAPGWRREGRPAAERRPQG